VLDVAAGADLFEAGSRAPADGITLLKDHVTGIVSLQGLPALPAGRGEANECNQFSSGMAEAAR
jgi:hypothetical protein